MPEQHVTAILSGNYAWDLQGTTPVPFTRMYLDGVPYNILRQLELALTPHGGHLQIDGRGRTAGTQQVRPVALDRGFRKPLRGWFRLDPGEKTVEGASIGAFRFSTRQRIEHERFQSVEGSGGSGRESRKRGVHLLQNNLR